MAENRTLAQKSEMMRFFKLYGLNLRSDVASYLCQLLEPLPQEEHTQWVEAVIEALQKLPITSDQITKEAIYRAAEDAGNVQNVNPDSALEVIDVFKIPRLTYDVDKRKFIIEPAGALDLHGKAADKATLFRNRYNIIHQRTIQHELFKQPVYADADLAARTYSLKKVEFLLGASCRQKKVLVLGLLTSLKEGKYHLEDDTGHIELDLSNASFHSGLFTVNCFVLVEGCYEDNVLHAEAVGLPPPELPAVTRERMSMKNENYFGGSARKNVKTDPQLHQLEKENGEAMFVVLSDVWLDKLEVMEKLRVLFSGYAQVPPTAFILCGNFFSEWQSRKKLEEMQKAFTALGNLIAEFPDLAANTRFIFVPGPSDPGPSTSFPRPPLPRCVTEPLRKKVRSAVFATNPCRLVYCTQEMVVLREDLVGKMCRNSVHFPQDCDLAPHVARTIVNQCHLAPLPLHTVPVYWNFDHCMSLYPTPDVIIIADKDKAFSTTHSGTTVFNPGSFFSSEFSFKVYFPSARQVEDSQISSTEET